MAGVGDAGAQACARRTSPTSSSRRTPTRLDRSPESGCRRRRDPPTRSSRSSISRRDARDRSEADAALAALQEEAARGITDGDVISGDGLARRARHRDPRSSRRRCRCSRTRSTTSSRAVRSRWPPTPPSRWASAAKNPELTPEQRLRVEQAIDRFARPSDVRELARTMRVYPKGSSEYEAARRSSTCSAGRALKPLLENLADEPDMAARKSLVDLLSTMARRLHRPARRVRHRLALVLRAQRRRDPGVDEVLGDADLPRAHASPPRRAGSPRDHPGAVRHQRPAAPSRCSSHRSPTRTRRTCSSRRATLGQSGARSAVPRARGGRSRRGAGKPRHGSARRGDRGARPARGDRGAAHARGAGRQALAPRRRPQQGAARGGRRGDRSDQGEGGRVMTDDVTPSASRRCRRRIGRRTSGCRRDRRHVATDRCIGGETIRYSTAQLKAARKLLTRLSALRRAARFYPMDHPAVADAVARLGDAIRVYHDEGVDVQLAFFEGEILLGSQLLAEESMLFDQLDREMRALGIGSIVLRVGLSQSGADARLTHARRRRRGGRGGRRPRRDGGRGEPAARAVRQRADAWRPPTKSASPTSRPSRPREAMSSAAALLRETDLLLQNNRQVSAARVNGVVRSLVDNVLANRYAMLQLTGAEELRRVHVLPLGERRGPRARAGFVRQRRLPVPLVAGDGRAAARHRQAHGRSGAAQQARAPHPEEWAHVRQHPVSGAEMIAPAARARQVGDRHDPRAPHALGRHRLPRSRTARRQQHLCSRIVAVADSYDAMTSRRSYSAARVQDEAMLNSRRAPAPRSIPCSCGCSSA